MGRRGGHSGGGGGEGAGRGEGGGSCTWIDCVRSMRENCQPKLHSRSEFTLYSFVVSLSFLLSLSAFSSDYMALNIFLGWCVCEYLLSSQMWSVCLCVECKAFWL